MVPPEQGKAQATPIIHSQAVGKIGSGPPHPSDAEGQPCDGGWRDQAASGNEGRCGNGRSLASSPRAVGDSKKSSSMIRCTHDSGNVDLKRRAGLCCGLFEACNSDYRREASGDGGALWCARHRCMAHIHLCGCSARACRMAVEGLSFLARFGIMEFDRPQLDWTTTEDCLI